MILFSYLAAHDGWRACAASLPWLHSSANPRNEGAVVTLFRRPVLGLALVSLLLPAAPLRAQTAPETGGVPAAAQAAPAEAPVTAPETPVSPSAETQTPAAPAPGPAAPPAAAEVAPPAAPTSPDAAEAPPSAPAAQPASPSVAQPVPPVSPAVPVPAPVVAEPAAPPAPVDPKDVKLKIGSQGGAYMRSQELAYFQPFARRSGYGVSGVVFDGTLAALKAQGNAPAWDIVDLEQGALAQACEHGLLEPFDASIVQPGPDGTPAAEDFLPGAIQPCGVANVAWSAAIVYDKGLKTAPTKIEHVFDLKRYPGKRALPRTPQHTLELALLADGVAPAQVYTLLASKEGQDRAFAKLNTIKEHIVWWDRPRDALDKIAQKQAAMGLAFNGRAFMAMIKGRQPLALLWDHQIFHLSYWAVPKGAKFAAQAREFIGFATGAGPMSDQTRWLPYGPARLSAVRLVGRHAELNLDMKPFLPTHQPNLQGALAYDGAWWSAQAAALKDRFSAWLEGREPPAGEAMTSQ
jgi:putative spermidine/putrescine transport system substrate-binding protein